MPFMYFVRSSSSSVFVLTLRALTLRRLGDSDLSSGFSAPESSSIFLFLGGRPRGRFPLDVCAELGRPRFRLGEETSTDQETLDFLPLLLVVVILSFILSKIILDILLYSEVYCRLDKPRLDCLFTKELCEVNVAIRLPHGARKLHKVDTHYSQKNKKKTNKK